MAVKRFSDGSSIKDSYKMSRGATSAAKPDAPTIGTATATGVTTATVAYTAATLGATATTFTATSSPSSLTGTGSSPITVSGLSGGTNYTFTVKASNANGDSVASSASNQITTTVPTSYESIATTTVGSGGQATVTFSSIPATFTHLQIRAIVRSQRATDDETLKYEFNGDTSLTTSSTHLLTGSGSTASAGGAANYFNYISEYVPANSIGANIFGIVITDILDYANTNKNKTIRTFFAFDNNSTLGKVQFVSNGWRNASAISSITVASNTSSTLAQYTQFALYGIKA